MNNRLESRELVAIARDIIGEDYGKLQDVILESLIGGHKINDILKIWGLSGFSQSGGFSVTGNKADVELKTPTGKKRFRIVVTQMG